MLVLAKAMLAMMIGFIISVIFGLILVPLLKKINVKQRENIFLRGAHSAKDGTPTMGGLIFIIPTFAVILLLLFKNSISISSNLIIVLLVFGAYGLLGFADDYIKIRFHNNAGLSILFKLLCQVLIALAFFYIYMVNGGSPTVEISSIGFAVDLKWIYGMFILFLLVGTSNAVNITDGLDGLAGGLSVIAFLAYGIIAWNTTWMDGNDALGIFCFVLVGALLGFLVFNSHPAKVFMGDTGSLLLGGVVYLT